MKNRKPRRCRFDLGGCSGFVGPERDSRGSIYVESESKHAKGRVPAEQRAKKRKKQ